MKYSVVDISSSGLSAIVAEVLDGEEKIIYRERVSLSLMHYFEGGRLSARGTDKLIDALSQMKNNCKNMGAERLYLISTAALRNVKNYEEIREAILSSTGIPLNPIDGKTEAYCDHIANSDIAPEGSVLADIGGKSIEICDMSDNDKGNMISLDFGLIDLQKKFVKSIQPTEEEAKKIKKFTKRRLERADVPGEGKFSSAVLVGSTSLAVYDMFADHSKTDESGSEKRIQYKKFKKFAKHMLSDISRSKLILENAPEKLYIIGPAVIVIRCLFKHFGVDDIIVSDRGVKEGYLKLMTSGAENGEYLDFTEHSHASVKAAIPGNPNAKVHNSKKSITAGSAKTSHPRKNPAAEKED